jgi:HD-GYP domain-containing protein (c-di-GMP phosphodiesterase class II)
MRFSDLNKKVDKKAILPKKEEILNSNKDLKKKENELPKIEDVNEKKQDSNVKSNSLTKKEGEENKDIKKNPIDEKRDVRFSIQRKVEEKSINFNEEIYLKRSESSYSIMISSMKNIIESLADLSYVTAFREIEILSDLILKEVSENRYILNFIKYLTPRNYIISHSLNLSIIVAGIANQMGIDIEITRKLVISSLCIDFGMLNYKDIFSLERKFQREEFEIIKSHINDGLQYADKVFAFEIDLRNFVRNVIKNSHERYDGSGYFGLKGDELDIRHQIVAIADVYEAMTHKRPWRDAYEEPYVVSFIIKEYSDKFERNSIKSFLRFICLYPESSIVKLSTGEIARVILNRSASPTRAIVKVIMDENFREIEPYNIDLFEFPLTHIDGWVSLKEMKIKNPDFYRKENLERLWLEF